MPAAAVIGPAIVGFLIGTRIGAIQSAGGLNVLQAIPLYLLLAGLVIGGGVSGLAMASMRRRGAGPVLVATIALLVGATAGMVVTGTPAEPEVAPPRAVGDFILEGSIAGSFTATGGCNVVGARWFVGFGGDLPDGRVLSGTAQIDPPDRVTVDVLVGERPPTERDPVSVTVGGTLTPHPPESSGDVTGYSLHAELPFPEGDATLTADLTCT